MSNRDPALDDALGLLAQGLAGAIEIAGLDFLPRPPPPATSAPLPAAIPAPKSAPTPTPPTPTTPTPTSPQPAPPTATAAPAPIPAPAPTVTAPGPGLLAAVAARQAIAPVATDDRVELVGAPLADALRALAADDRPAGDRLRVLQQELIGGCTRCKLHRGRNKLAFGVGNPEADLVFVGEGPGEDEDRQGVPFVGRAGQLLTKMISAMDRDRDRDVYICNVVKCRPPNNRNPEGDEVDACVGFLNTQLALVRPRVIVGLGAVACHALLKTTTPITKLRGTWQTYQGIAFMPTFHPSYLLREERDPGKRRKREAWQDLKLVMERLARSDD